MKKSSPEQPKLDQSQSSPSFTEIQGHVFTEIKSGPNAGLYIGRDRIEDMLRSLLRDEAKNIQSTRLWEVLNASILNEAYNLALIQSADFEHVQFAKALKHWSHFMLNVIHTLSKE